MDIKKAGPLVTQPFSNICFIILMFLIFVFYRSRFSFPCQTYVQEYARYMRIVAFLYLIVYRHYQVICVS